MPLPILTGARSPAHGLPYLFPGQAQKEAFVNEGFARIDALLQPVAIEERAAPPAAPAPGDCYLVGAPASGSWIGRERALAVWAENQWLFCPPREGARIFDLASGAWASFTAAGGWQRTQAPAPPSAGATQDAEARAAIAALVAALRAAGIFSA